MPFIATIEGIDDIDWSGGFSTAIDGFEELGVSAGAAASFVPGFLPSLAPGLVPPARRRRIGKPKRGAIALPVARAIAARAAARRARPAVPADPAVACTEAARASAASKLHARQAVAFRRAAQRMRAAIGNKALTADRRTHLVTQAVFLTHQAARHSQAAMHDGRRASLLRQLCVAKVDRRRVALAEALSRVTDHSEIAQKELAKSEGAAKLSIPKAIPTAEDATKLVESAEAAAAETGKQIEESVKSVGEAAAEAAGGVVDAASAEVNKLVAGATKEAEAEVPSDAKPAAGMSTTAKIAIAGAGLVALWLLT